MPFASTHSYFPRVPCWQLTDRDGTLSWTRKPLITHMSTTNLRAFQWKEHITSFGRAYDAVKALGAEARVKKVFLFWQKKASKRPLFHTVSSSWLSSTHNVCQLGKDSGLRERKCSSWCCCALGRAVARAKMEHKPRSATVRVWRDTNHTNARDRTLRFPRPSSTTFHF